MLGAPCAANDKCCSGTCENGSCKDLSTCSGNTTTCAAWLSTSSILYKDISCDAQMHADDLITCLCMFCAGACTDEPTCTQAWHENSTITNDCKSCLDAEEQSTCLSYVQSCQSH
jgi:hypothetical protein